MTYRVIVNLGEWKPGPNICKVQGVIDYSKLYRSLLAHTPYST